MRVVKDSDKTEKQKIIFEIADKIYHTTFEFSEKLIEQSGKHPALHELADWEVISFLANIYTKIFCHGFVKMLNLKREKLKEHDSTERELLDECVEGIYTFLNQRKKPTVKTPTDGIMRLKSE